MSASKNDSFDEFDSASDVVQLNDHNSALRLKNEQLVETVASLKRQLDEAIEFSEKNAILQVENTRLLAQVRSLSSEKEDLEKRVGLLVQINEENKKNEEESMKNARGGASSNAVYEQNAKLKQQLEEAERRIDEMRQENESFVSSTELERVQIEKNISNALLAARSKYKKNFSSLQDLTDFFLFPEDDEKGKASGKEQQQQQQIVNDPKIVAKLQKMQRRTANYKKIVFEQRNEIKRLESEINAFEGRAQMQENDCKNKIKEEKHKFEMYQIQNTQTNEKLKTEIETMRGTIKKLQDQCNIPQHTLEMDDQNSSETDKLYLQINSLNAQLNESTRASNAMRQQILQMSTQLKSIEQAKDAAHKKIDKLKQEKNEMISLEKQKDQMISQLQSEISISEEKFNVAMAQVKSAKLSFQQSCSIVEETEKGQNQKDEAILMLQRIMEEQKVEIQKLYIERERIICLLQKHSTVIASYSKMGQTLLKEKQELKLKGQGQDCKPILVPEQIPVTSWFCSDFPRELCTIISDFAKNESLSSPIKLRNILPSIAKYYGNQINTLTKDLSNAQGKLGSQEREIDGFLTKVGTILGYNVALTLDELADIIDNIFTEKEQTAIENQELYKQHDELLAKIEAGTSEEAIEELNKLFEFVETQSINLNSMHIELKKQYKINKLAEKEIASLMNEKEFKLNEYHEKIETLTNSNLLLTEKLYESEKNLAKAQGEKELDLALQQKQIQEKDDAINDLRLNFSHEMDSQKNQLDIQISKHTQVVDGLNQEINRLTQEISQWKNTVSLLQSSIDSKDKEINALHQECDEIQNSTKINTEELRKQVETQFSNVITQLKSKNEELITLNDKLLKSLEQNEERIKLMTKDKASLEHSLYEIQSKANAFVETKDRENRIEKAKTKAKIMEQEIAFQCALEDEKDAHRTRLQTLFDYASTLFKEHFDFSQPLNETNFTNLCDSVRSELNKLQRTDEKIRRLLGIKDSESPEEALSNLLLSFYSK